MLQMYFKGLTLPLSQSGPVTWSLGIYDHSTLDLKGNTIPDSSRV